MTKVPGLLGIDHIGITVPDVDAAASLVRGRARRARTRSRSARSPTRSATSCTQLVDVDPRAVVEQIRMVRGGNGPGVELFQYTAPDQDQTFRKNSDWGGHHIAFYVRHIDKAVEYLQRKGAQKRLGPFAVTAGPGRRADDQLLPDAVRHRHRADQLPARDGVRGDGGDPALGPARQPPVTPP